MNIFYTDHRPDVAAQNLCDRHVVKMVLESCQMLSTAAHYWGYSAPGIYKPAYANHPSTVWARATQGNFNWLYFHAVEIAKEYELRYNKYHSCIICLRALEPLVQDEFTAEHVPPPQCMFEQYKQPDTLRAYRDYYLGEKMRFAVWTNREAPWWVREHLLFTA